MNTLKAEKKKHGRQSKEIKKRRLYAGNLFGREIEGSLPIQMTKKGSRSAAEDGQQRKSGYAGSRRQDLRCTDQRG